MKVALFVTCLVEAFAPQVAEAAARLVAQSGPGIEVVAVGDACCGQPAWNAGYPAGARALARRLIPRLAPFDLVVVPSGSCAAMLIRSYPHLFQAGDPLHAAAEALAGRTRELTAFLAGQPHLPGEPVDGAAPGEPGAAAAAGAPEPGAEAGAGPADRARLMAFHPSCHSLRGAGVGDAGERCLARAGHTLAPHADRQECCGFGGLFAVKEEALSSAMADRKCDALVGSGAKQVVAAEMGCLLHLEGRARRRGIPLRFRHIAEVLGERGERE